MCAKSKATDLAKRLLLGVGEARTLHPQLRVLTLNLGLFSPAHWSHSLGLAREFAKSPWLYGVWVGTAKQLESRPPPSCLASLWCRGPKSVASSVASRSDFKLRATLSAPGSLTL